MAYDNKAFVMTHYIKGNLLTQDIEATVMTYMMWNDIL
jgi:hypothetical protein